jgi:hypothetical protein
MKDDELARKARAESIRRQIDQLNAGKDANKSSDDKEKSLISETPAEFIHRRMEELNNEENGSKSSE